MEEILLSRGVTIHVPEESSTEIVFALKQVEAQLFWVILKDDPTWVFYTKAECIFYAHYSRYDNTESDQGRPELEDPPVIHTLPLLLATTAEFQNNSLGSTTGKMRCIKYLFWLYFPAYIAKEIRSLMIFSLISASGYKDTEFSTGTAALHHTAVELQCWACCRLLLTAAWFKGSGIPEIFH